MNWLPNTLLSALLLLVTYLLLQQQHINARLDTLQQLQQNTAGVLADSLQPLSEQLTLTQSGVDKLVNAADAASRAQLQTLTRRSSLVQALAELTLADLLLKEQRGQEAAQTLENTKKAIWEAGDFFTGQQQRLQGLMGPIDSRITAWQQGDLSLPADEIRKELTAVLGDLK